jgi:hypothetical protein
MTHKGSCHCGRIAFEVEGDVNQGNCSHCSRVRYLPDLDRSQLKVVSYDGRSK